MQPENSWYIVVPLNEEHLFTDRLPVFATKIFLMCRCGEKSEFVLPGDIGLESHNHNAHCLHCGNSDFIYHIAYKKFHDSLYETFNPFKYEFLLWSAAGIKLSDDYQADFTIMVPKINYEASHINFVEKRIATIALRDFETQTHSFIDNSEALFAGIHIPIQKQIELYGVAKNQEKMLIAMKKSSWIQSYKTRLQH